MFLLCDGIIVLQTYFCVLCAVLHEQNHEKDEGESDLTKNAFKILYATDEDHDAAAAGGGELLDAEIAQVQ